jgi:NAD(P)-dependent dehydrogenase (short-subunit alcohol dehydrogenase family)
MKASFENPFNLSGETAVVIGATGVLGGSLAEGLAASGATVVVAGRNKERGEERVSSIVKAGGRAHFVTTDASDRGSLEKALAEITAELGNPTILVNAAGGNDPSVTVTPENPFEAITEEAWTKSFDMNLVGGALLPCQVFGPHMAANGGGSIINIASVSAHLPLSRVVAYSAAKVEVEMQVVQVVQVEEVRVQVGLVKMVVIIYLD